MDSGAKKNKNVLFICTSQKDRSPALEKYFRDNHPEHLYRSAGVNKFFTEKKGTHLITKEDIQWADLLVFAEEVHYNIAYKLFGLLVNKKDRICLNLGNYEKGNINQDYLKRAEKKLYMAGIIKSDNQPDEEDDTTPERKPFNRESDQTWNQFYTVVTENYAGIKVFMQ